MRMMSFLGQLGLFGWKDMPVAFLNLTGPMVLLAAALLCAPKTNALGHRRNGCAERCSPPSTLWAP